jgi:tetratricopeptide (TPR) repeat protein
MRTALILLLAGVTALAQTKPATPAQLADAFYRKGLAAEAAGDYPAAKAAYTEALRNNPRHANCTYRLKQLELNKEDIIIKGRKAQLDKVVLPEVKFDGASLDEALAAVGTLITKESANKLAPNFIVQDPNGKISNTKITLNLKNLPASAVLTYLLDQAKAKARYDEHAVVIEPR